MRPFRMHVQTSRERAIRTAMRYYRRYSPTMPGTRYVALAYGTPKYHNKRSYVLAIGESRRLVQVLANQNGYVILAD